MKKICCFCLMSAMVLAVSCQRDRSEPGGSGTEIEGSEIPADFTWETTRDVSLSVGLPSVSGTVSGDYAVIRVFSSPKLLECNLIAKGVVSLSNPEFRTAFTLPLTVDTVFVQTTLPDGTIAEQSAPVSSQINLHGAVMTASGQKSVGLKAPAAASTMVYPAMAEKSEADFPEDAIIRQTPSQNYQIGASWASYAGAAYYIPAGAVIDGNIDLTGGFNPIQNPILYVAGKLNLVSPNIGTATLAVLPGGEVTVTGQLSAQNRGIASQPAIYVFKGGKLTAASANISGKSVVNCGVFTVSGFLDINNQLVFYNTDGAELRAKKIGYTNSSEIQNSGTITADEIAASSSADMTNFETGLVLAADYTIDAGNAIYQKGTFELERLETRGSLYVQCYTGINRIEAEKAKFFIASGACLEADEAEFNNTDTELSAGALVLFDKYNLSGKSGSKFTSDVDGSEMMPVIKFGKAICSKSDFTHFHGAMEVVYDDSAFDGDYVFDDKNLQSGAVLHTEQQVNIPATDCNKGKGEIETKPEPEPDYNDIPGAPYTFCFEDNWPWTGDYDMNDVVVKMHVDRRENKQGLVEFIKIRWEVLASGASNNLSLGVRLDRVRSTQIASVETTNPNFGIGPFAGAGLEQGDEYAVFPLFNSIGEVLSKTSAYINTYKGSPSVATTEYVTTVVFAQPVAPDNVTMSAVNTFIVVNPSKAASFSRACEVHLPGFVPTIYGDVSGKNSVMPNDPYRYYMKGENRNNGMMWGLMIPGTFRYPSEMSDIRNAYRYFEKWACSGGTLHKDWYQDEVNEQLIY